MALFQKSDGLIGLDIGSGAIKVAQIEDRVPSPGNIDTASRLQTGIGIGGQGVMLVR